MDPIDRVYERVLVLRCQTGDEAAFTELIARYHVRLRRFLQRMLDVEPDAAEDALQDLWLDVFRGVGKLRAAEAFTPWLWRLARDRAYRILRRRGIAICTLADADVIPLPCDEPEFDTDDRQQLTASLQLLPHAQREVLLLRFVEDMSYEQIAAAAGCGLGTVRSRLHYAKRALRDLLERNKPHDKPE